MEKSEWNAVNVCDLHRDVSHLYETKDRKKEEVDKKIRNSFFAFLYLYLFIYPFRIYLFFLIVFFLSFHS